MLQLHSLQQALISQLVPYTYARACWKKGWLFDENKSLCIFAQNYFSEKNNYIALKVY